MATTSEWTPWQPTSTDAVPDGELLPSPWTAWRSATTHTPEKTEWWVASAASWAPAALFSEWTAT